MFFTKSLIIHNFEIINKIGYSVRYIWYRKWITGDSLFITFSKSLCYYYIAVRKLEDLIVIHCENLVWIIGSIENV